MMPSLNRMSLAELPRLRRMTTGVPIEEGVCMKRHEVYSSSSGSSDNDYGDSDAAE